MNEITKPQIARRLAMLTAALLFAVLPLAGTASAHTWPTSTAGCPNDGLHVHRDCVNHGATPLLFEIANSFCRWAIQKNCV